MPLQFFLKVCGFMISVRELLALQNQRKASVGRILIGVLVPVPFIAIGLALFFDGIKDANWASWLPGIGVFVLGIVVGFLLLKNATAPARQVYALFEANDVYIDESPCRRTEQLALDLFNGEIKPALRYIAESADLFRWERKEYISEWQDYEKDYIRNLYGKDPLRVTLECKTKELTLAVLEEAGLPLCSDDPESTCYQLHKKCCTLKTAPSYLVDGDESYRLHFGDMGSFECSGALYNDTNEGDFFYIICNPFNGSTCMVYHTLDWHLGEELAEFLQ